MSLDNSAKDYKIVNTLSRIWQKFWFELKVDNLVELIRILVGTCLLVVYASYGDPFFEIYQYPYWEIDSSSANSIQLLTKLSPLSYLTSHNSIFTFHLSFLFCCLCLSLGFFTKYTKWLVFAGFLSYHHANPNATYGVDVIICSILTPLCIAPIGSKLSIDSIIFNQSDCWQKTQRASMCIRILQLQSSIMIFYAGLAKLRIQEWRNGEAIWRIISSQNDIYLMPLDFLAKFSYFDSSLTFATILIELCYPFWIWNAKMRKPMLLTIILFHLGIAICMKLWFFSAMAIILHLSFLNPQLLDKCLNKLHSTFRTV